MNKTQDCNKSEILLWIAGVVGLLGLALKDIYWMLSAVIILQYIQIRK